MTQPTTTKRVPEDDEQPAKARDLRLLKQHLGLLEQQVAAVDAKVDRRFDELRDHFDATIEIIKDEFRGANADEISSLKDAKQDHEERLGVIEQKMGLR